MDSGDLDLIGNDRTSGDAVDMGCYEHQHPDSGAGGTVTVAQVLAAPTRVGAEILFTLSADADVDVTIRNIAGRVVRRVATQMDATKGRNSLLWNAMSDSGLAVPTGMYLVEISAKSADGSSSRGMTQIRVNR